MKQIEVDRHIVRYHFKETYTISLPYMLSSNQLVDVFTKSHSKARFHFFMQTLDVHSEFEEVLDVIIR